MKNAERTASSLGHLEYAASRSGRYRVVGPVITRVIQRRLCAEFQAKLDATAERGTFADAPWVPTKLQEIVDYGLGCDSLPTHPQDAPLSERGSW